MAHFILPMLQYREKIHHIVIEMIAAVVRTGVTQRSTRNAAALEILIELYDKELSRVAIPPEDEFGTSVHPASTPNLLDVPRTLKIDH